MSSLQLYPSISQITKASSRAPPPPSQQARTSSQQPPLPSQEQEQEHATPSPTKLPPLPPSREYVTQKHATQKHATLPQVEQLKQYSDNKEQKPKTNRRKREQGFTNEKKEREPLTLKQLDETFSLPKIGGKRTRKLKKRKTRKHKKKNKRNTRK